MDATDEQPTPDPEPTGEPDVPTDDGSADADPADAGPADTGIEEVNPDGAPPGAAGHAAGGPGAALQAAGVAPQPPRPPKRTGVFLDPDDLRVHVGGLLRLMLGGYQVDAYGNFTFTHDSAQVFVTVGPSPIGPQVGVFSITNVDVELTPPLAGFLATTNHQLGFGSLSYDAANKAVWLRHSLLGTTLDGPELQAAVASVASTAARIDDHIAEQFGGRTFDDAPKDVQQQARPPETPQQPYQPGGGDTANVTGYL